MLLTLKAPVSGNDLGYLLLKNPARLHTFDLPFGKAYVFYPELTDTQSQAALLLNVDPIDLVRGKPGAEGSLDQYVNDRPYAASSFLSVAISRVLGTALSGKSKERQDLADRAMLWEAVVSSVPCYAGTELLASLFEPLGYEVTAQRHPLDEKFPEWGEGKYYTLTIRGLTRLQDLLIHLYVLIPVLDADKHYWVGADEVDKLIQKGEGWLAAHPSKELITARYLHFDRKLIRDALARLVDDDNEDPDASEGQHLKEEEALEAPVRLWEQRIGTVLSVLDSSGAQSVIDLGCGEGKLLRALLENRRFTRVAGMDVSWRSLETMRRRIDRMPAAVSSRLELIHGSLLYRDSRLSGFDAATVIEVVEHLDPPRLAAFERVLFEEARPRTIVITTPNVEYNALFKNLPPGHFRHRDHRFEWTRSQFQSWSSAVASRFGYSARFLPVGPEDPTLGAPTQMGVFSR